MQAWEDAARLLDDKWDHVFGTVVPSAQRAVAAVLGLPDPDSLVFAPNTHEFVLRIVSTLPDHLRILTSDSEFHSFARQSARWEEAGTATVTSVPAEPLDSFPQRLVEAYAGHDLVYVSQVHFNSGYVVPDLAAVVGEIEEGPTVVVDGYHGFMAVPTDLGALADRVFYLAGGYKYAMAGEGACFLHVPPSAAARPLNTGWWAGYDSLTGTADTVAYGPGGRRFAGATFDPSGIYRLDAVLRWLEAEGMTVEEIHRVVGGLQTRLLGALPAEWRKRLVPGLDVPDRGHFLTFRRSDAADVQRSLRDRGIITDHRADRLRVGLGIYHDDDDIDRLAAALSESG